MSLTDRDRKIVILLLPVVVILAYWFLLLSPKRHEAKTLSTQVTAAEQSRDAAVAQAAQLEQAKSRFATEYAQMVELGKALPTNVDMRQPPRAAERGPPRAPTSSSATSTWARARPPPRSRRSRCPTPRRRRQLRPGRAEREHRSGRSDGRGQPVERRRDRRRALRARPARPARRAPPGRPPPRLRAWTRCR